MIFLNPLFAADALMDTLNERKTEMKSCYEIIKALARLIAKGYSMVFNNPSQ